MDFRKADPAIATFVRRFDTKSSIYGGPTVAIPWIPLRFM